MRGSALAQPLLGRTCASHDTWLSSAWAQATCLCARKPNVGD